MQSLKGLCYIPVEDIDAAINPKIPVKTKPAMIVPRIESRGFMFLLPSLCIENTEIRFSYVGHMFNT